MSDYNKEVIKEFRANDGVVGGYFAHSTLLLLHTTGAKRGQERINPVVTFEDNDRLFIIASAAGAPANPDWYHNIVANPMVDVEYGSDQFKAQATVTSEPERTELYAKAAEKFSAFADYKKQTTRIIPVVTLSRLD